MKELLLIILDSVYHQTTTPMKAYEDIMRLYGKDLELEKLNGIIEYLSKGTSNAI